MGLPVTLGRAAGQIRRLYRAGFSKADIARRLDISRTSVRRVRKYSITHACRSTRKTMLRPIVTWQ